MGNNTYQLGEKKQKKSLSYNGDKFISLKPTEKLLSPNKWHTENKADIIPFCHTSFLGRFWDCILNCSKLTSCSTLFCWRIDNTDQLNKHDAKIKNLNTEKLFSQNSLWEFKYGRFQWGLDNSFLTTDNSSRKNYLYYRLR